MKKLLAIEGMTCEHCQARVEKALNGIEGVQAKVNLKHKEATVTLSRDVPDEEPICVASRMRCASPPDRVAAARERVR